MNRKNRKLKFIRMKNNARLDPNSQYIYKGRTTSGSQCFYLKPRKYHHPVFLLNRVDILGLNG